MFKVHVPGAGVLREFDEALVINSFGCVNFTGATHFTALSTITSAATSHAKVTNFDPST